MEIKYAACFILDLLYWSRDMGNNFILLKKILFLIQVIEMNQQITHNAPAGKKYKSIRDAGEQTLAIHCDKFPQNTSNESFLLPVLFETSHPENIKSAAGLPASDQRGLKGLEVNIHGERGEYEV